MSENSALSIIEKVGIATIDHMTHIDNLDSIFKNGLLAHNNPYKKIDISNKEVNDRRNKLEPIYNKNIHDYVPLYFNPRNAMLYRNQRKFGDAVVILAFNKNTILLDNSFFTNDIKELEHEAWNWNMIWSRSWNEQPDAEDIKWSMMAEVLIYEKLEITQLQAIYCSSNKAKKHIEDRYHPDNIEIIVNSRVFF